MIAAATFMIVVFTFVFSEMYQDNLRDKKRIIAEDFSYSVQNEFIMASESHAGYVRTFTLPEDLEGFSYEVSIIGSTLLINYTDAVFALPIPKVNGFIQKGVNTIVNQNNTICINC